MKTENKTLICSSLTLEGLTKMINNYYYSTTYSVSDDLVISNSKGVFEKAVVIKSNSRGKTRYAIYN